MGLSSFEKGKNRKVVLKGQYTLQTAESIEIISPLLELAVHFGSWNELEDFAVQVGEEE